jgi:hypothetical protein
MKMTLQRARNLADQIFTQPHGSIYGSLSRIDDGREALAGVLFVFGMQDRNGTRMLLQLYSGLGDLGGALWEQEARTLMRLSSLSHPGLPRVLDGGHKDDQDIAFVLTEEARYTMAEENAMEYMVQHRHNALRQVVLLADALRQLHSWRVLHRNLWPGALEVVKEPEENAKGNAANVELRLARFEMSTLVSNLLRSIQLRPNNGGEIDEVRQLYQRQGARALVCFPPERLAFLYPGGRADMLEDGRSDVFGLGMIAQQWFTQPLSDDRLRAVFGEQGERYNREAMSRMHQEIREELNQCRDELGELGVLIIRMLNEERNQRPTAAEVCDELSVIYPRLITAWDGLRPVAPGSVGAPKSNIYLVSTAPDYYKDTLCRWGFIEGDPTNPIGWEEFKAFVQDDLAGGTLNYSPDGFVPYQNAGGNVGEMQNARYVLVGKRVAYFASEYEDRQPFRTTMRTVPEVLHIRYALDLSWRGAQRLSEALLQQPLPSLEVVQKGRAALDADQIKRDQRPSWRPLLQNVAQSPSVPPWQVYFEQAIEFLLDVHSADLDLKQYAFRRTDSASKEFVTLQYDTARDNQRVDERTLNRLYIQHVLRGRLDFGDFFADQEDLELVFFGDEKGRPSSKAESRGRAFFVRRIDPHTIQVTLDDGAPEIPQEGWLMPGSEWGSVEQLRRERLAKDELFENPSLMQQLHRPKALVRQRGTVSLPAGFDPKSPGAKAVTDMMNSWPFYALHGPPGTGKTTVAAAAVRAALLEDQSLRILISAQSHFSLDNMAERILEELTKEGFDIQAMRIASPTTEQQISSPMKEYLPRTQAEHRVRDIISRCEERLATGTDSESLRAIIGEWKANAESSTLEIMDRLRRGTNLIFATCSGASLRSLDGQGDRNLFDWVLVEEAAKAWATELAIPLVRGLRWTLIGDFHQLSAFGREEYGRLLDACAQSEDFDLRQQTSHREEILQAFDLFRNLFEPDAARPQEDAAFQQNLLQRPLGELTLQYRMRDPIGQLVSRITYRNKLQTAPAANREGCGLTAPKELVGRSLVWIDTGQRSDCHEERFWFNPGEAALIKQYLQRLRPSPLSAKRPRDRLAILTPFRRQKETLIRELGDPYLDLVHTVDSFQGKEADIVIVSMVRTNDRVKTSGRLGFLTVYQRANVLLSRARKLLIIVGNFRHFSALTAQEHVWNQICAEWRDLGDIVVAPPRRSPETDQED